MTVLSEWEHRPWEKSEPKAIDYETWLERNGGSFTELGQMIMVTDKMRRVGVEWGKAIGGRAIEAFAHRFYQEGYRPISMASERELDISMRATQIILTSEGEFEGLASQYLVKAYLAWGAEEQQRIAWENASLWRYLKHWLRRYIGFWRRKEEDC